MAGTPSDSTKPQWTQNPNGTWTETIQDPQTSLSPEEISSLSSHLSKGNSLQNAEQTELQKDQTNFWNANDTSDVMANGGGAGPLQNLSGTGMVWNGGDVNYGPNGALSETFNSQPEHASSSGKSFGNLLEMLAPAALAFIPAVGPYLAAATSFGESAASGNTLGMITSPLGALTAGLSDASALGDAATSITPSTSDLLATPATEASMGGNVAAANNAVYDAVAPTASTVDAGSSVPSSGAGVGTLDQLGGSNFASSAALPSAEAASLVSPSTATGTSLTKQVSDLAGTGKDAYGLASLIKNLVNGSPSLSPVDQTYGTNLIQSPSEGGTANATGSFLDRQLYDQIGAIRQRYQLSGSSGSAAEQQEIQQALSQMSGG